MPYTSFGRSFSGYRRTANGRFLVRGVSMVVEVWGVAIIITNAILSNFAFVGDSVFDFRFGPAAIFLKPRLG